MLVNRKYYFLILILVILLGVASITPAWTAQKPVDLSTTIIQVAKQNLSKVVYIEVIKIGPKSPLKEAGFETGDIILAIENQPIRNLEGFVDLVSLLNFLVV